MRVLAAAASALLLLAPAARAADVEAGHKIASDQCSRCHAVEKEGISLLEGAPPFRTLGEHYPIDDLAEALAEGIVTGHPQMPEFEFTPEQIDDLLAYLSSIQQ
ncbi:MAG: cytochrome c [Geminicoccaceae bacterium]